MGEIESLYFLGSRLRSRGDEALDLRFVDEHAPRLRAFVPRDDPAPLEHVDQTAGSRIADAQAALAKAHCTSRMRETVAYAREVLGGNGILLDHDVARFFNDAEALYSYEGTREINTLIVGRAITGLSAFV